MNAYYASIPDRLWEQYRNRTQESRRKKFFDDLRAYLLEQYHCNFTMFVEDVCDGAECQDEDFWMMVSEESDPKEFADDMFHHYNQAHRQRTVNGSMLIP